MMTRRVMFLLATISGLSCGDSRAGADREKIGGGASAFVSNPTFAGDGRLAYSTLIDGKSAIVVADANGKNVRRVSYGVWDFTPVWSPDGQWIAFGRDVNGGDVFIVPADSGAERAVPTTPFNELPVDWMPDGSALLFVSATPSGDQTWIFDLSTGKAERFIGVAGSARGFPSRDPNVIGYVRSEGGKSTIWVWDRATDTHRQLTTEGFESVYKRPFSPDGRSILYTSTRTGTLDIWRVDVASGERTQLTQDVGNDGAPQWSPDGSHILFESDRGGQSDVWMLATGEADVQRLTDDALDERNVAWSAEGGSVVFVAPLGFNHVHVVPLDGSPARARTSGEFGVLSVNVSADGELIAYSGTRNGDPDIWVVPVAEGEPRLVSAAPGVDGDVRFSPDARDIAFVSQRGGSADIWVVPTAGGEARRLTDWPSTEFDPRWSVDGRTIFFRSDHESRGSDLWAVPATGGTPVRRTSVGTVTWIRLSPDGQSIALGAETAASGGSAVFTQPVGGGALTLIASAHTLFPQWSRDSREIALLRSIDGYGFVEIYNTAGALVRRVSTGEKVYEFPGGWTFDGARMIVGFQDIFVDGANRMAIQSVTGGPRTLLAPGEGLNVADAWLARDVDVLVAALGPVGSTLVRVRRP